MKIYTLTLFICISFLGLSQDSDDFGFELYSTDKAGNEVMTYCISSDSIIVYSMPYLFLEYKVDEEGELLLDENGELQIDETILRDTLYKSTITNKERDEIKEIVLLNYKSNLKGNYWNECIIDGMILDFYFYWEIENKNISLSNCYLEELESSITFINKSIPKKYQIWYDGEILLKEMEECGDILIYD